MVVNKQDKEKIATVFITIAIIALVAIFYKGTRYVPLFWLGVAAVGIEVIFLMPYICKQYFWVKGYDIKFWPIPFVNIIQCFPAGLGYACIGVTAIIALLFTYVKLPASVVMVFGESFNYYVSDNGFALIVVLVVILSILIGIGYSTVLKDLHGMLKDATGGTASKFELFYYVLLFIPVIRVCGLSSIVSSLSRLKAMGYYEGMLEEAEYEEDESYE